MNKQLSIRLAGNLADSTAEALGCRLRRDHGVWLVTEYVDQAQLTGLVARLAGLNVDLEAVEVTTISDPPGEDPEPDHRH